MKRSRDAIRSPGEALRSLDNPMIARYMNGALWSLSAAICAAAASAPVMGFLLRDPPSSQEIFTRPRPGTSSSGDHGSSLPPLSEFASVWSHPLRRPLAPPAAGSDADPKPVPAAGGLSGLTLVGTIGESMAVLRQCRRRG